MVQRCGHTCRTIRGVDGLSRSTLFFRGKLTPWAARRYGRPPGVLPPGGGRDPQPGCRGNFAESPQNLCTLVQKVAHSSDSFVTLREKVVQKVAPLPSRVAPFGAGVPKTAHFDQFLLKKRNFYSSHLHQTIQSC